MSRWPREIQHTAAFVTPAGADWLASASHSPRDVHALWARHPAASVALPCGTAFDVVSMDALFGRRVVSRLWTDGPGTGPVAAQGGRVMLFATPGAAQRLPALLGWEEWGAAAPPLLCYGWGDAVTVPPLFPPDPPATESPGDTAAAPSPRWLVAPDVRNPWLPGPEVLLWACVRAARAGGADLTATTPVTSAPAVFPG
ncbi:bifunctional DNA primase/polymerase [Streptomyces cucumeris]|uniref:bifunctional DNA primase/polymerase n=1 Tax=Streptomyces cucumeris TaxID=2962890 RepID=UPI003EBB1C64